MFLDGILFATVTGILGYLIYEVAKVQLTATAATISRKEIASIVRDNPYFRLARLALMLLPVAGLVAGLSRTTQFVYVGLGAVFLLLMAFGVTFLIGSFAIDRFKRR